MLCVQDGCLAKIASKGNVSISRVAGCVDAHEFFVDSTPHIDGATGTRGICGMLNGAPGCALSAGRRITPSRRHVESVIGLVKRSGGGWTYHKQSCEIQIHLIVPHPGTPSKTSSQSNSTGRSAIRT